MDSAGQICHLAGRMLAGRSQDPSQALPVDRHAVCPSPCQSWELFVYVGLQWLCREFLSAACAPFILLTFVNVRWETCGILFLPLGSRTTRSSQSLLGASRPAASVLAL